MARRIPREIPWRLVVVWHTGQRHRGRYQVDSNVVRVTALSSTLTARWAEYESVEVAAQQLLLAIVRWSVR